MINFSDAFEGNKKNGEEKIFKPEPKDEGKIDFAALNKEKKDAKSNESNMNLREKLVPRSRHASQNQDGKASNLDTKALYDEAILLGCDVFEKRDNLRPLDIKNISLVVSKFVDSLDLSEQAFLEYLFADVPSDAGYLSINSVNTMIIALEMAHALNYTKEQLSDLGVAAFLHKIGLKRFSNFISQNRQLTPQEKNETHKYPLEGTTMIRATGENIGDSIISMIEQHHERFDGTGYPRGLKDGDIKEAAQIIGLADFYEALVHKRPYRDKFFLLDAFKLVVKNKAGFNPLVTKTFLERMGVYPKGATVELNTKEIACVIKQNYRMPLCPVVKIISEGQGRLEANKEIDLGRGAKIYITKAL